ncbi:MAG: LCP family protein [Micrococcaceae bacterium]
MAEKSSLPSHHRNVNKVKVTQQSLKTVAGSSRSEKKRAKLGSASKSAGVKTKAPKSKKSISFILAMVMSTLFLGISSYFIYMSTSLKGSSMSSNTVGGTSASENSALASENGEPIDVLVMGTDTRQGAVNKNFGDQQDSTGEGNSDVMMLVRISADRTHMSVVSFPRDLLVPGPECTSPITGETTPAQDSVMLNSIMSYGGPSCSAKAFTNFTGIQVDHYVVADFNSVIQLSKIIGGVEVCVNKAVDDPLSGLNIPAGKSEVEGDQALAFLRSRHGMGNGSDIDRIKSQQQFLSNMAKKLKSSGTLLNPIKVNDIANAMIKYLTFDNGIANVPALVSLAGIVQNIPLDKVTFVQAPVEAAPTDANRVVLQQPDAKNLFKTINADKDLSNPSSMSSSDDQQKTQETATAKATSVNKSQIPLAIFNGSGTDDRDTKIVQVAQSLGYTQAVAQPFGDSQITSIIYYASGEEDAAKQVATDFGLSSSAVQQADGINGVQLVIGTDFTSGNKITKKEDVLPDGLSGQTANDDTCQVAADS